MVFPVVFTICACLITDVCNFRCTYCLPDGYRPPDGNKEGRKSFLSLEEIRRIVSGFAAMGTRKVRLTGGTLTAP